MEPNCTPIRRPQFGDAAMTASVEHSELFIKRLLWDTYFTLANLDLPLELEEVEIQMGWGT
jgi:hypothetical protein